MENNLFTTYIITFLMGMSFMFFGLEAVMTIGFQKQVSRLKIVLSFILFAFTLGLIKDLFFYIKHLHEIKYYNDLSLYIDYIIISTFAFYPLEIVKPGIAFTKKTNIIILPYFIFIILFLITGSPIINCVCLIYTIIYCTGVVFYTMKSVKTYNRAIENNYSSLQGIDLKWCKTSVLLLASSLIIWVLSCIYKCNLMDCIYYLTCWIPWTIIVHHTRFQKPVPIKIIIEEEILEEENADLIEVKNEEKGILSKLDDIMEKDKLYLNKQLSLSDLARIVGTNRTYLSKYLNQVKQTTFYDYVNNFRLNEAEKIITSEVVNIEDLAFRCGFNSVSTFRRCFSKKFSCSPTTFTKKAMP